MPVSPLLAGADRINVFTVPPGYFEELAQKIRSQAILYPAEKRESLQVPEGYFNTLSDRILARVHSSEAEEVLSPLLASLRDKNPFTVPPHYFHSFSGDVIRKINIPGAKVITMASRKKQGWKYAAAAIVTGIIALASLQLFTKNTAGGDQTASIAASMPDYIRLSLQYKTPEALSEGIASLSDEDIVNYLEKNGNITDNELLIKDADVQNLPSADDYLLDTNTLNNYLEKIHAGEFEKNTY